MLVTFHSDCESIYKIVEDIGGIIREIRELEDQVKLLLCQSTRLHSVPLDRSGIAEEHDHELRNLDRRIQEDSRREQSLERRKQVISSLSLSSVILHVFDQ